MTDITNIKLWLNDSKKIGTARKRFGDAFDEKQFRETNGRILDRQKKIDDVLGAMKPKQITHKYC